MDSKVEKYAFSSTGEMDIDQLNNELNDMHADPVDRWKVVSGLPFPNAHEGNKNEVKFVILLKQKVSSSMVKFYLPSRMKTDQEFIMNVSENCKEEQEIL